MQDEDDTDTPETEAENEEERTTGPAEEEVVLAVQESRSIPAGTHLGRITSIETRETDRFGTYVDIGVDILDLEDDGEIILLGSDSVGFPAKLTPKSWLGQLLEKFGAPIGEPGATINIAETLKGRAVQFETEDERTDHGTYAVIDKQSLRPHPSLSESDVWENR